MPKPLEITPVGDREVVVRREFDAPPAAVFRCFTEPDLIRRWYGYSDWDMTVCEYDARVGGRWRFVARSPSGYELGSSGEIREFLRPLRIVSTELYDDDWTGGETLITTVFNGTAEGTSVTLAVLYASEEARSGALATPMAEGMEHGFTRLDDVLAVVLPP